MTDAEFLRDLCDWGTPTFLSATTIKRVHNIANLLEEIDTLPRFNEYENLKLRYEELERKHLRLKNLVIFMEIGKQLINRKPNIKNKLYSGHTVEIDNDSQLMKSRTYSVVATSIEEAKGLILDYHMKNSSLGKLISLDCVEVPKDLIDQVKVS